MKPIALFGDGINAYSPAVSRQRRLNCFYDIRRDGDKVASVLRGTPGTATFTTLPTSPIRGWHVVKDMLYVVAGPVLYSISTAGVQTILGALTANTTPVAMADNGVQLVLFDGLAGYVYTLVSGTYKQSALNSAGSFGTISDANFPNGCISASFLDGRILADRPNSRQCYESELYDATNWTNVSSLPTYMTKENSSDLLLAVDVLNGMVVLWGAQSIEFWQDVGSFPNPFARINGATQTWGLAAIYSRCSLNNTMIFLGKNPQGGVQVMTLNGYVPQRVSNSDIENIFATISQTYGVTDAVGYAYIVDGHPMYQITFPAANRSFLYDSLTDMWAEVQTGLALLARHFGQLGIAFNSQNYITDKTSGNIYQLRTDVYTDNGTAIKRQVVSRHITGNAETVGISQLFLDMETGVGLENGQGSDPQVVLQVSKDGGRTFGIERPKSLGKVGEYRTPRVLWRRLGSAKDFVFQFTMTDPVKFTVMQGAVEIVTPAQGAS